VTRQVSPRLAKLAALFLLLALVLSLGAAVAHANQAQVGVAAEGAEAGESAATTVRRFVRQDEFNAIQKAIGSGDKEVQVGRWFTPDNIASPRVAAEQLALPGTDADPLVGYFDMPASSLPSEPFATFGPRLVNPDFFQPGAGLEIEVSELFGRPTVPTAGLRLVGF